MSLIAVHVCPQYLLKLACRSIVNTTQLVLLAMLPVSTATNFISMSAQVGCYNHGVITLVADWFGVRKPEGKLFRLSYNCDL